MSKILFKTLLLNIALIMFSAANFSQIKVDKGKSLEINFSNLKITIQDVKLSDYKLSVSGNTAIVESIHYEGIDGKKIYIQGKDLNNLKARIRFEFGYLQYLTDEKPPPAIDFTHKTNWTKISIKNNTIQIPQFYGNTPNVVSMYQHLKYANTEGLENFLEKKYFKKVKKISYKKQRDFYQNLLINQRERYEKCCPEYIEQAGKFLSRQPEEFKSFKDLSLELFYSKIVLELSVTSRKEDKFKYYLVGKD